MSTFEALRQAVIEGQRDQVVALTQLAIDEGHSALAVTNDVLTPALREVGSLFEQGDLFVPEMLVAAQAMQAGMDLLKPLLSAGDYQPIGKVVMGSVKGDIHDIGKSLVALMLDGRGFEVIDLGVDVPPGAFVEAVEDSGAVLVGLSGLLTTSLRAMEETVRLLQEANRHRSLGIMVGGAPVTPAYATEIGADGTAPDASRAVELACSLLDIGSP